MTNLTVSSFAIVHFIYNIVVGKYPNNIQVENIIPLFFVQIVSSFDDMAIY
jgi:hypothetical protein